MSCPRPARTAGYILAATLWILAIVSIGAAYFAERVSRALELAQQSQDVSQTLVDVASTRAEIFYRLGISGFSEHGLGISPDTAIALDDRPYQGTNSGVTLRLQDARGLLNINFPVPEMLVRFLGQAGIPAESRNALIDTLLDYVDVDDLRRLNGAEAAEYAERSLPPPPNDWLMSPYQLQNVIGWRDAAALWNDQHLARFLTTARVLGFNPNTAPFEVLAVLPGSSPEIAKQLISLRQIRPFASASQISSLIGGAAIDAEQFVFFPANSIRVTLHGTKLPWAEQYQVTLTPASVAGPWRIDSYARITLGYPAQDESSIPRLPPRVGVTAHSADAL